MAGPISNGREAAPAASSQLPVPSPCMLGLYVHIPFCSAICNYCNFNRGLFDAALKVRYVDALVAEIERAGLKACTTSAPESAVAIETEVVQACRSARAAADT